MTAVAGGGGARRIGFDAGVERLLRAEGLPVDDLGGTPQLILLGLHEGGRLAGVVGLERHGAVALLRSLAVAPDCRSRGLGRTLVAAAEAEARAAGVGSVYLLTRTAAPFFEALGYVRVERDDAPEAIRATAQFTALCPASASLMRRPLD